MTESPEAKFTELLQDIPIAMFTTIDADGVPRSVPMARQQVDASTDMWFITARDTRHVEAIRSNPRVGLTFSSRDSWVAATGTAEIVDDLDKLRELWNTFAEAWLPGGPEDPNATLVRVDIDSGEYWDSPGGKIASALSFVKTKITGETYDTDHGEVTNP